MNFSYTLENIWPNTDRSVIFFELFDFFYGLVLYLLVLISMEKQPVQCTYWGWLKNSAKISALSLINLLGMSLFCVALFDCKISISFRISTVLLANLNSLQESSFIFSENPVLWDSIMFLTDETQVIYAIYVG